MINRVKIVGRYELLDPIGHGGMAVVYLARQTDLDRQVALKELRMLQAPDDPSLAERFLREARVAGSMSHPNIVTVHEYFKHEGTPYIAMEYLERGSLRPWVGHLTVAQIAGVLEGLLAALDHAERYRIVHRDLKPENLLVTDQGQVKVADFGIAKARTMNVGGAFLTATGTTIGTPSYMAPEQARALELGPYTDLYSVGVMAYELFTGRIPFHDADTPVAIILRHINEQIPPAHTVNPTLDRRISDWIDRLLVKEPAGRTQTAAEAWEQLEEIVIGLLASRWRREARLGAVAELRPDRPVTPAPFTSMAFVTPAPAAADGFESFALGRSAAGAPATSAPDVAAREPVPVVEPVPEVEPRRGADPAWMTFANPDRAPESPPQLQPDLRPDEPVALIEPVVAVEPVAAAEPVVPVEPVAAVEPVAYVAPVAPAPSASPADERALETVAPHRGPQHEWAAPIPSPPPAVSPTPTIRRRRRAALGGAGALVLAAAAGGVVLSGGGRSTSSAPVSPARTLTLSNADLSLTTPASWSRSAAPAHILGLRTQHSLEARRTSPAATLAAELAPGNADPSLLSPKLLAALTGRRPKPETVTLAGLQAYRYAALRPRGSAPLRVYAVLTTGGVATVACSPATPECDASARTLKLTRVRALPVGPDPHYAAILKTTFASLQSDIRAVKLRFAKAPVTVATQIAAQQQYARVYTSAIASLRRGGLSPVDAGLRSRLVVTFKTFVSAYQLLERAVRDNDAGAKARAEHLLGRAHAKSVGATDALDSAGYSTALLRTPRTTVTLPPPAPAPAIRGQAG